MPTAQAYTHSSVYLEEYTRLDKSIQAAALLRMHFGRHLTVLHFSCFSFGIKVFQNQGILLIQQAITSLYKKDAIVQHNDGLIDCPYAIKSKTMVSNYFCTVRTKFDVLVG